MAHLAEYKHKTPEKWQKYWNSLYSGEDILFLTEPLVSEVYYVIKKESGSNAAECYLIRLKGMKNVKVIPKNDGDKMAFQAGELKVKYHENNISLVDSYVIASALTEHATICTSDEGIQKAASAENLCVNFIPKKALTRYIAKE